MCAAGAGCPAMAASMAGGGSGGGCLLQAGELGEFGSASDLLSFRPFALLSSALEATGAHRALFAR